jgi:ketosteroid isomerase-like protein
MTEEPTTPDLAEITRRSFDAVNRRDFDTLMSYAAPDLVYDNSPNGLGVYEGQAAIRTVITEYWDTFEDLRVELEDFLDLGNGVTFAVHRQHARPIGSTAPVQTREGQVTEWVEGRVMRVTMYLDIDEARAAAERLAEERG